ncbi:MAG: winged helix-turn-helix transcriptional regulator [Candidatus Woesearchaeota archaeon]
MKPLTLTKNENKVLRELQKNSRESRNVIAKRSRLSRSGVDKTIRKLLGKKIIAWKTITDYNALGYNLYKILINLEDLKFDKRMFLSAIKNSRIIKVFLLEGRWDMEIVAASDIYALEKDILNLKREFLDEISDINIVPIIELDHTLSSQTELKPIQKTLIEHLIDNPQAPLYNLDFISFDKAKKDIQKLPLRFSINIDYELIGKIERKYFIAFEEYNRKKCLNFIKSKTYSFISKDLEYFDLDFNMIFDSELEETKFIEDLKQYGITEILFLKTRTLIDY